ncbi:MAG TPA: hypothetical protein VFY19_00155 [Geminicoccaceae bacterium]|nr:hypothetical protein [Geminicoccaceae bacterium]
MGSPALRHRLARRDDVTALTSLMEAAIATLQKPFLDDVQISASRAIMGLDTQLIDDRTYFVVEQAGALAGCGGWSRRATLYGGDRRPGATRHCWTRPGTRPACAPCTPTRPSSAAASGV